MEFGGAGTAIMIAVAAVLWFLYLVPSWMRHREERAAELAERRRLTVGVESAAVWTIEGEEPGAAIPVDPPAVAPSAEERLELRRVRQRRARRLAAGLLIASIVALVVQGWILTTAAATVASWVILSAAACGVIVSVAVQRRLDRRAPAAAAAAPARRRPVAPLQDIDLEEVAARGEDWTPVPVPKPLYLSRAEVLAPAPRTDAGRAMRAASAASEERLRVAQAEPEVRRIAPPAARRSEIAAGLRAADPAPEPRVERGSPSGNRYATMGLLDDAQLDGTDLDDVLARRRRVG